MQIVVAVVGALVGAVSYIALQELWQRHTSRHGIAQMRSLVGDWSGTWWIGDDEMAGPYVPADNIRITVANNGRVRGEGRDEKGAYSIEGNLSEHGIASMFYGYRRLPLNGVMILRPSPEAEKYSGYWHGYTREGQIVGGIVQWTRADG